MGGITRIKQYERDKIYALLCRGFGVRAIAKQLGRDASVISREIKRNSDHIGYDRHSALLKNRDKRYGRKIDRNKNLKEFIVSQLHDRRSPEVIAAIWNQGRSKIKITSESIYSWIYLPENMGIELYKYLPRHKKKRGIGRTRKNKMYIQKRHISERPDVINKREEAGHFEFDLTFYRNNQSKNVLVGVDRASRLVVLIKNDSKKADEIMTKILRHKGMVQQKLIKTATFDNGSEFAQFKRLESLGIMTYFCTPGSPWEKASAENINSQLRYYLPFNEDIDMITQERLDQIALKLNNTPRKILGFKTPVQIFNQLLQRESDRCCN